MTLQLAAKYTPRYCESLLAENPGACAKFYERILKLKAIADVAEHTDYVLEALKDGPKAHINVAVWCRQNGDPGMEGELAHRILDRLVREGKAFRYGNVYALGTAAGVQPAVEPESAAALPEEPSAAAPTSTQEAFPPIRANGSTKTDVRVVARRMQPGKEPSIWPPILEECAALNLGQYTKVNVPDGHYRNVFAQDVRNRLNASATKQWAWAVEQSDSDYVTVTKRGPNPKWPGAQEPSDDAVLSVNPTPLPGRADAAIPRRSGVQSPIAGSLLVAVTHIDTEIAALQAAKVQLIEMAQRFQDPI